MHLQANSLEFLFMMQWMMYNSTKLLWYIFILCVKISFSFFAEPVCKCNQMKHSVNTLYELLFLLQNLLRLVRIKGPYTEGVFRKSCNMKLANEIYKKLDEGLDCLDENTPVLVVAHLLKVSLCQSIYFCLTYFHIKVVKGTSSRSWSKIIFPICNVNS